MSAALRQAAPIAKALVQGAYRSLCSTRIALNGVATRREGLAVHYGGARRGDVGGPLVKVQRLTEYFPDTPWGFNVVYLLSNAPYLNAAAFSLLKKRKVPIVYNQNGVFYPAWFAGDWRAENARMTTAYRAADWVFYQSDFCRRCADEFLGPRSGRSEILFNAIDTERFVPSPATGKDGFEFLLTGKIAHHLLYRLESTIRALAVARRKGLHGRLTVGGFVEPAAEKAAWQLAHDLQVAPFVAFLGSYTQAQAPAIYGRADAYVMTKHNDPCPNTVLEAMACGLPIVYSSSGGVPELVGSDAGVGVACPEDFETVRIPDPDELAAAMLTVAGARDRMARAARARAVQQFDIRTWIHRHRTVFTELLGAV